MSNLITIQHLCMCLFSSFSASPQKNSHYSPVQHLCGNPRLASITLFSISSGYFLTNTPSDTFIMILVSEGQHSSMLSDNNVLLILFFKPPAFPFTSNRDLSCRARTGERIMPFFCKERGKKNKIMLLQPFFLLLLGCFNEQLQMTALITASGH